MGGYTGDLLDKPIEYIAWGAVYWSAARRRTSRSQTVNQAIRADRCEQRAENEESVLHKAAWLERLLAEGVSKTKQADGGIHEDQLLNFLVNRLDEEVSLSLANNAEITAEDIYGVLVGACADGTSVSTLCASSQNSPAGNTVLYHLRTKFEPEQLERVALRSCERISMNCSPNRWRSAQTSTCGPTTVTKTTQTASITR